jgi:hypothetical protein
MGVLEIMGILKEYKSDETPTDAFEKLKGMNTQLYTILNSLHKAAFDYVWNNKKFTPKEMVDAMGINAVLIFTISSKIQEVLYTVNPTGYVPLSPTKPVTFNQDGSASVEE